MPAASTVRSAFRSAADDRFATALGRLNAWARYSFHDRPDPPRDRPPLPSGIVTSLGIKAFCRLCRESTRLPVLPDRRSLPAAVFYY